MKEILYSICLANLLFLALVLATLRKGNAQANRWLAAFFLITALLLLQVILEYSGFFRTHPALLELVSPLTFLWGTTYYFYTKSLTGTFTPSKRHLWHLLPALLCLANYLPLYLAGEQEKIAYFDRLMNDQPTPYDHLSTLGVLHFVCYLLCCVKRVGDHQKNVKNYFSGSLEKRNLSWLRRLNYGLFFIWILWANFHLHELLPQYIPALPWLQASTPVLVMGLLFSLGYYAVRQSTIFPKEAPEPGLPPATSSDLPPPTEATEAAESPEPRPSALSEEQKNRLRQALLQCMQDERVYQNPDLTLPELATRLGTTTNILSDFINREMGQNFYDFVNGFRVEECKALLLDPQYSHFTILGIAYEAGFNSKSTFHKAFRASVGLTPGEFRKENRKKEYHGIDSDD